MGRSSSQGRHNGFEIDSRGAFLFSNPCLLHIFSQVIGTYGDKMTIFDESAENSNSFRNYFNPLWKGDVPQGGQRTSVSKERLLNAVNNTQCSNIWFAS